MSKTYTPIITPSPVTGMTTINKKVIDIIDTKTYKMYNFNKPKFIKHKKLWIIYKNLYLIILALNIPFARLRGYKTIYNVPASDKALFVSFFIFLMSYVFMNKIIHHHHVFSYIYNKNRWILWMEILGKHKIHNIFLCDIMKDKYNELYNNKNEYFILDNIHLMIDHYEKKEIDDKIIIGYLSNITVDKGFEIFSNAVLSLLNKNSEKIKVKIAGPIQGEKEQEILDNLIKNYPENIDYLGSVYNDEKEQFFKNINIFLFPTIYKNEAQPLVIYEALAYNNLVLSMKRGCISNQIANAYNNIDEASFIHQVNMLVFDQDKREKIRQEQYEAFLGILSKKDSVLKNMTEFIQKEG